MKAPLKALQLCFSRRSRETKPDFFGNTPFRQINKGRYDFFSRLRSLSRYNINTESHAGSVGFLHVLFFHLFFYFVFFIAKIPRFISKRKNQSCEKNLGQVHSGLFLCIFLFLFGFFVVPSPTVQKHEVFAVPSPTVQKLEENQKNKKNKKTIL